MSRGTRIVPRAAAVLVCVGIATGSAACGNGLSGPESVVHDPIADVYLVSNLNGPPTEKDGNGFIARIGPDGRVLDARWIEGGRAGVTLDAPKGLALAGDVLWVADIDRVRAFDRRTGEPRGDVEVEGARFLNGLAVGGDGSVYVSDSGPGAGAIHRILPDRRVVTLARGPELERPNGLAWGDGELLAVGWGGNRIYAVSVDDASRRELATLPGGRLDGLVRLEDGTLLASSWETQAVHAVSPDGRVSLVADGLEGPADLGFDARRGLLLIPELGGGDLTIVPFPPPGR